MMSLAGRTEKFTDIMIFNLSNAGFSFKNYHNTLLLTVSGSFSKIAPYQS